MSQQENTETKAAPQNVRVVPIFVEGRDEPVINRDFVDSSGPSAAHPSTQQQHHHHHRHLPDPPHMERNMDFEIPAFRHGSIFDRAKDFPVRGGMRDNIRDFFRDETSPTPRGESPMRQNHTAAPEPRVHNFRRQASPQPQQAAPRPRTFSGGPTSQHQQQQHHPAPAPQKPTQEQPAPPPPPPAAESPAPKKEATPPPAPKPAPLDPISKIQQIQRDVLDLMNKVEQFEGKGKKDKEYLYLDEMLTQNLLKLDTVDTDGKDNVKLARKEAVKCINRCLAVLEAKAEAGNEQTAQPSEAAEHPQQPPSKQSSRGSVYDNHEVAAAATTSGGEPTAETQDRKSESPPKDQQVPAVTTQQTPVAASQQ